jgi:hypothetical protein
VLQRWEELVISWVGLQVLGSCRLVCKEWNQIISSSKLIRSIYFSELDEDLWTLKRLVLPHKPSNFTWYYSCKRLLRITANPTLAEIIGNQTCRDKLSVLLYLPIIRVFLRLPDEPFSAFDSEQFQVTDKEMSSMIVRHNIPSLEISERWQKQTKVLRTLSEFELIAVVSTILQKSLRMQFCILAETVEHLCGLQNANQVTLQLIKKFPTIFITFQKKKTPENSCWILRRASVKYVATNDVATLVNISFDILRHYPKGIKVEAFRTTFEQATGLPFGYCCNTSLDKFLRANPKHFILQGKKIVAVIK